MANRSKKKWYINCKTDELVGEYYNKGELLEHHSYSKKFAVNWITRCYNPEKYQRKNHIPI